MELNGRKRYRDAQQMLAAFSRIKSPANPEAPVKFLGRKGSASRHDWHAVRRREFLRQYGKPLEASYECTSCDGPVSEAMRYCPWCGKPRGVHRHGTRFPAQCPRCHRGLKADWQYCPWCYGAGFDVQVSRHYSDRRYTARCDNPRCERRLLMPFMRYCPWCHRKVQRRWKIAGSRDTCSSCGWGVLRAFWTYCPWCGKRMES
jgi:hypothetical protein